jgi:catechol 2,3-dioxygenase-like lactoylglutathione lyase family enzyme
MPAAESLRLGTVMLGVREMDRSLAFYRDRLGFAVQFASADFSFLSAGGVTLALRAAAGLEAAADPRWSELVFHVEDIDAAHRQLQERGVAFRVEPRIVTGEQLAADFRDPDGHLLSILGVRRGGR